MKYLLENLKFCISKSVIAHSLNADNAPYRVYLDLMIYNTNTSQYFNDFEVRKEQATKIIKRHLPFLIMSCEKFPNKLTNKQLCLIHDVIIQVGGYDNFKINDNLMQLIIKARLATW
jgi:hypothetical protein